MDAQPTTEELRQRLRQRRLRRLRELIAERMRVGDHLDEVMRNVWLALWDEITGATAKVDDDGQWRDGVLGLHRRFFHHHG